MNPQQARTDALLEIARQIGRLADALGPRASGENPWGYPGGPGDGHSFTYRSGGGKQSGGGGNSR